MMRALLLCAVVVAGCSHAVVPEDSGTFDPVGLQRDLLTRAEATDFRETSSYEDVEGFLAVMDGVSDEIHTTTFGETAEGRELPLAVWGAPGATPEAIRATGKTRVLVFANIHAGEVAGKEAALMILRDLANGRHAEWADSLVVMIAPIYNADGNERVEYGNRPYQLGPVGGMGQRPNAQGLDLNRDFTRLASPEARALVGLMRDVDPHVVVDLHTTDGTFMGYHLTFAPPLSPNTPATIDRDLRQRWIPNIQGTILRTDDMALEHYGNVPGRVRRARWQRPARVVLVQRPAALLLQLRRPAKPLRAALRGLFVCHVPGPHPGLEAVRGGDPEQRLARRLWRPRDDGGGGPPEAHRRQPGGAGRVHGPRGDARDPPRRRRHAAPP